jgi:hyperosmotically inducible periplasmic protein
MLAEEAKSHGKKSVRRPGSAAGLFASVWTTTAQNQPELGEQVRRELVMLPWYSVFDNLEYTVEGGAVTLTGQVTRPSLKTDAEVALRRVERISKVVNNIEVLPLSSADDWIRVMAYRTLYSANSPLARYGAASVPQIHILVKNGHITLAGVVERESHKNLATLLVKSVPGVFSVSNTLRS